MRGRGDRVSNPPSIHPSISCLILLKVETCRNHPGSAWQCQVCVGARVWARGLIYICLFACLITSMHACVCVCDDQACVRACGGICVGVLGTDRRRWRGREIYKYSTKKYSAPAKSYHHRPFKVSIITAFPVNHCVNTMPFKIPPIVGSPFIMYADSAAVCGVHR